MKIIQFIETLIKMNFTEIEDFIDYIRFHYSAAFTDNRDEAYKLSKAARQNRTGKPTGGFPDPYLKPNAKTLTMTTEAQQTALDLFQALDTRDKQIAHAAADAVKRKIAPRRVESAGTIQVKFIPYERMRTEIDPDTGISVPVRDENGKPIIDTIAPPYLYLRYWQKTAHDDKRRRRYKSVYIGGDATGIAESTDPNYEYPYRALADYFYNLIQTHGVKVKPKNREPYYRRPQGDDNPIAALESQILGCIDLPELDRRERAGLDKSAAIDHDRLSELQKRLTDIDGN